MADLGKSHVLSGQLVVAGCFCGHIWYIWSNTMSTGHGQSWPKLMLNGARLCQLWLHKMAETCGPGPINDHRRCQEQQVSAILAVHSRPRVPDLARTEPLEFPASQARIIKSLSRMMSNHGNIRQDSLTTCRSKMLQRQAYD